ncbi:hypothetical protein DPMN_046540 [Dreissena polymorpha]|uniref:Uncharacterized protein n=1 Tax=Dreissena polymorpha TaxID=45954 RepID=A0A9D4D7Z4_DREPO|nr:hypothetical protein DPMN_046540 [Dreissena polymorpha]
MTCRIAHGRQLKGAFEVIIRVRKGCLLSPFLLLLAIGWEMNTSQITSRTEHSGHSGKTSTVSMIWLFSP